MTQKQMETRLAAADRFPQSRRRAQSEATYLVCSIARADALGFRPTSVCEPRALNGIS